MAKSWAVRGRAFFTPVVFCASRTFLPVAQVLQSQIISKALSHVRPVFWSSPNTGDAACIRASDAATVVEIISARVIEMVINARRGYW